VLIGWAYQGQRGELLSSDLETLLDASERLELCAERGCSIHGESEEARELLRDVFTLREECLDDLEEAAE
jgi:hypothetical protein